MNGGIIALIVIIVVLLLGYLVVSMIFKTFNPLNLAKMAFGGAEQAGKGIASAGESAGKGIVSAGKSIGL